jgi:cytochrome c2
MLGMLTLSSALTLPGCPSLNGPANPGSPPLTELGNADSGKQVFRFETFGNEGFWTEAMRLPQGMRDRKVTPLQALRLGISFDSDALDEDSAVALSADLALDPSGEGSALLNDPEFMTKLFNLNAVIGLPVKDSSHLGHLDITKGSRVGASCALCHSITDGALMSLPTGGTIGHRLDGRAAHALDFGSIVALSRNPLAYFPLLQVSFDGKTIGRSPVGLTENSTEEDAVAYLTNKDYYPVGMFDDAPDGNGAPMHNMPLFRQDLASPFGSAGEISTEDNFANQVYVALLDPTSITTPGGRAFEHKVGAKNGDELVEKYVQVLAATGVTGYPFVKAAPPADPSLSGTEGFALGVRVNEQKLIDMNAYVFGLQAPAGVVYDQAAVARGQILFRITGCTSCHNVDQGTFIPTFIVPMKQIFPGDNPKFVAARVPPLTPIEYTPGATFDTKMAVINASLRGLQRGIALPLLLDLARKPVFLHDNSVATLDDLLNPARGPSAPHPFYLYNLTFRLDMTAFLNSLDTKPIVLQRGTPFNVK